MYISILGTRAWTPRCLQKWARYSPTNKATYGFTVPPCWEDRKKIRSTRAASNCQTLEGLLQLHPRKLDQKPDLPATDVKRIPGSCQDKQWPGGLAKWPEPARQRTFAAAPVHLDPTITAGSNVTPGLHMIVRIVPIVPVVSKKMFRRPGRSYGGLFSPRSNNVNFNKDKQTNKQTTEKRLLDSISFGCPAVWITGFKR